jgi:hypothetical protein
MRAVCLILILANALFFSWAQLVDVRGSTLDRAPVANAAPPPRIVLAREVATTPEVREKKKPAPRAESAPPSSKPVVAARGNALGCSTVGPFADLADASQAQAALRSSNFEPRQRLEQGELWVGYWVSVQNLKTREDAEDAIESLREGGITDVYLMPGGDPANVLSLGVFSDYQRAQRRSDEVRALGLEPRIDDRKREGTVYWIDVDLTEAGKVIDTTLFQSDPGKIMRLEVRDCPTAAGAG